MFFFFFSSRRRHTRSLCDWSSDVCSSDLARVEGYLAHRLDREAQVLAALAAGDRTPAEVVARVYAGVDRSLHPAAELSVRAHLAKLTHEGRVTTPDGERFTLNPGRGGPIREGNPGRH